MRLGDKTKIYCSTKESDDNGRQAWFTFLWNFGLIIVFLGTVPTTEGLVKLAKRLQTYLGWSTRGHCNTALHTLPLALNLIRLQFRRDSDSDS